MAIKWHTDEELRRIRTKMRRVKIKDNVREEWAAIRARDLRLRMADLERRKRREQAR